MRKLSWSPYTELTAVQYKAILAEKLPFTIRFFYVLIIIKRYGLQRKQLKRVIVDCYNKGTFTVINYKKYIVNVSVRVANNNKRVLTILIIILNVHLSDLT